jgi:type III secretory pathway component EscV
MVIFSLVCTAIVVTCLYALKHKLLAWPLQKQAAKSTAAMAFGLALLVCLFQFGFWAGVFALIAMLMVAAIEIPFLFAHLKQESGLR